MVCHEQVCFEREPSLRVNKAWKQPIACLIYEKQGGVLSEKSLFEQETQRYCFKETKELQLANFKPEHNPGLPDGANLANAAKNHHFPKHLPIFLAIFFNAKYLPFLKYQL